MTSMNNQDIRWKQRFANFDRAFVLLRSVFEEKETTQLSRLEREGVMQRFKYTYELAWKTMKDYMQDRGINIVPEISARSVIKTAFHANIIHDGQIWINMMGHRNFLSHC